MEIKQGQIWCNENFTYQIKITKEELKKRETMLKLIINKNLSLGGYSE